MNSTNPLEKQLASWTPRPPSPALKRRLFPAPRPVADVNRAARGLVWLVPALGTAMIVATVFVHPPPRPGLSLGGTNSALFAALNSAAAQSAQNSLPVAVFAWTNSARGLVTNVSSGGLN